MLLQQGQGQGQGKKALRLAKSIAKNTPDSPFATNVAGMTFSAQGMYREAVKYFQKSAKTDPRFVEARRNLAQTLILIDRLDTALKILDKITKTSPEDAVSWYLLGQVFISSGELIKAEECAGKAIDLLPNVARNFNLRALARERRGNQAGALDDYNQSLALDPNNVETLVDVSLPLSRQLQVDRAHDVLSRTLRLSPNHSGAKRRLAMHHFESGDREKAAEAFSTLLSLNDKDATAIEQLSLLQNREDNVVLKKVATAALKTTARTPEERASLFFAKAQIARQENDIGKECYYLTKANREMASIRPYNIDTDRKFHLATQERFAYPVPATRGRSLSHRPIYVLGLPRSGTTLAEAVLGAHSDVTPLGERASAGVLLKDVIENSLPFDELEARTFVEQDQALLPNLPEDASTYVDKMPENYRLIGFLKSAYPQCKIINLVRDPRDIALSMWRGHFSGTALSYTYDLPAMPHRFNLYAAMMRHWHLVFPNQILDVSYQALVTDIDGVSKEMAGFCGLDWNPAMAEPNKTKSQVLTLSANQVRQPVHTRSIGNWRDYEQHLAPFVAGLDTDLWPSVTS